MQLAALTAMLALCLNLSAGLSEHETRLYQLYGDRVFSVRAVVAESGLLYRFDQHDIAVLRDGLRGAGIAVAGLNLSYIDAREIDATIDGVAVRSHRPPTRIALVDATPLYFDIAGISVGLISPDSAMFTFSETNAPEQDTYAEAGSAQPSVISRDLASRLFQRDSSMSRSLVASGGRQLVIVDEASNKHLLPIIEELTPAGVVHRPERFVIYRPVLDPTASGSYGYLLFQVQGTTSLIDGMKSVSHLLTSRYPELRSDVYSEYERFAEQSVLTRSALAVVIAATFIGYAIAGACMYAEMTSAVSTGREATVRMTLGAAPQSVAALIIRRALARSAVAGCAGCVLYLLVSAVGVSIPELPLEDIGTRALPAVVGVATAVLTALVAAVSSVRKVFAPGPSVGVGRRYAAVP
jgi:hypothetical protein